MRVSLLMLLRVATAVAADLCATPPLPDPAEPTAGMVRIDGGAFLMGSDAPYP